MLTQLSNPGVCIQITSNSNNNTAQRGTNNGNLMRRQGGKVNGLPKAMQLVNGCSQTCTADSETSDLMFFRAGLLIMHHFTNSHFPLVEQVLDLNAICCGHAKEAACPDVWIQKTRV